MRGHLKRKQVAVSCVRSTVAGRWFRKSESRGQIAHRGLGVEKNRVRANIISTQLIGGPPRGWKQCRQGCVISISALCVTTYVYPRLSKNRAQPYGCAPKPPKLQTQNRISVIIPVKKYALVFLSPSHPERHPQRPENKAQTAVK